MHPGYDAAPAVVSALPFPKGSPEVAQGTDRSVSGDGAVGFLRFGVLSRRDNGMSIAGSTLRVNQINSEPHCFNAVLHQGQTLLLYSVGARLRIPPCYPAGSHSDSLN